MFLVKLIDQRQGESRIVDQQQVLRERLEQWLRGRPSAAELAERGILGRGQRFALARAVVDRLLRSRLRAQEEERARLPAGSFAYTERVRQLLAGAPPGRAGAESPALALPEAGELERQLQGLAADRGLRQAELDAAGARWSQAAEACRRAACTRTLLDAVADAGGVLRDLEAHHESTGSSLAGVLEELNAFQRLLAKKYGLQQIVSMLERTDAVREAAFAWSGADALPLAAMEELPAICAGLPLHSRAVGLGRLRFVLGPVRDALLRSLQEALRATGRWPLPSAGSAAAPAAPRDSAEVRALRLCADLQRAQGVEREAQRLGHPAGPDGGEASGAELDRQAWACSALAGPLVARFRHHFWRSDSELCRMDKPEWAFRYLLDLLSEHGAEIERWMTAALGESTGEGVDVQTAPGPLSAVQIQALRQVELSAGLAMNIADEARLFVRSRMPMLVSKEARPLLLHTIHHFVRFHSDISSLGGGACGAVAFADFDENRPVFLDDGERDLVGSGGGKSRGRGAAGQSPDGAQAGRSEVPAAAPGGSMGSSLTAGTAPKAEPEHQLDSKIGAVGARLMAGISHLRPLAPVSGSPEGVGASDSTLEQEAAADAGPRFLDVWAAADSEFVSEKISAAALAGGCAWRPCPVQLSALGSEALDGVGPQAGELATLVGDLFERARDRAECLLSTPSCAAYSRQVMGTGVHQVVAIVRERWNAMTDPLQEAREATLVMETLEEFCRFLDSFPSAIHLVPAVDEANALRISMIEALVSSLEGSVRRVLRSISVEPCLFTFALAPPLTIFSQRLRPSNFLGVARQLVGRLASSLFGQLLRRSPFSSHDESAAFAANCREDLRKVLAAVLGEEDLEPLRPLWGACGLLGLAPAEAAELLALLREALRCPGAAPLPGPGAPGPEAGGAPEPPEPPERRLPGALARAGAEGLPAPDALAVLAKRPDLAGAAADLVAAPLGALQELLPVGAAQATLQLGTGAIQQLGAHGAEALQGLGLPAALPIHAPHVSLQTGMAELKEFAGDAGRLFTGRLRSTLGRGAA